MFAAAIAGVSDLYGQVASTRPASDWQARITSSLIETGSLDALRKEFSAPPISSDALNALVQIGLEDGELTRAIAFLEKLRAMEPNNAAVLIRLARVQEMAGQVEVAAQTLTAAASMLPSGPVRSEALFRLAALRFDAGQPDDAIGLLKSVATPDATSRAGIVAYFYGRYGDAARYFGDVATHDLPNLLLEGNAALMSGDTARASHSFTAAEAVAGHPSDHAYVIERAIATARTQKALPELADQWLADENLPVAKALPLATILRELNRAADLLKWWKAAVNKPELANVVLGDRFVNEVLGAARSAGLTDQASAICRDQLKREPSSWQWLTAALRVEVANGRGSAADELLRERLKRIVGSPDLVRRVGRMARDLGRTQAALEAADILRHDPASAVAGCLLAASVHDRDGHPAGAKQALADAANLAKDQPTAVSEVAAALEGAGEDQQAIDLLQASLRQRSDDGTESRLASLLIKAKRNAEAIPLLESVMRGQGSAAVRAQASQRLLEAAVATRTTTELIDRTRDRLNNGHGDVQDLSLLVDALLSQKQLDAAVQAIRNSRLLDEPTRLRRLAVFYLRNERLNDAEKVLHELANADPGSFFETQERLASLAIKRRKPDAASAAINAIAQKSKDDAESIDRMAGVYNRLGKPAEAAGLYRRLLARQPANADLWLLWSTAMQKSGKAALARRRLLVLCGETPSDTVFAAAADALLNLNAPPDMLRVVRRDAMIRLSQRPGRIMLNHVLADLSEELSDPHGMVRATELGIAVSDDERSQRLRVLMDTAAQNGLLDTAIDCGRSLLALGDDFPPQLFLQLAERLLIANRPQEAAGAFARASESADPDFVAIQAGAMLEKYDFPAAALAALQPLQQRRAADIPYQLHLADLAETVGDAQQSFSIRRAAIDRLSRSDAPEQPESFDLLGRAILGALGVATTDAKGEILRSVERSARTLIEQSSGSIEPPMRLVNLVKQFRQAALFCDCVERADKLDEAVLAQWPNARAFIGNTIEERLAAGQMGSALSLARRQGVPLSPKLKRYAASLTAPATQPHSFTVKQAAELLPLHLVKGDDAAVRSVFANLTIDDDAIDRTKTTPGLLSPFRTLVIAANLIGDEATATRLALTWADTFEKPIPATQPATTSTSDARLMRTTSSSSLPNFYMALVSSSWQYIPQQARVGLIQQIRDRLAGVEDPRTRGTLALYILQIAAETGERPPDATTLGTLAVASQPFSLGDIAGKAFAAMPVADRPDFLRAMCKTVPVNRQLAALLAVVARQDSSLDDDTRAAMLALLSDMPAGQAIDWNDWFTRGRDPQLLMALARTVEKTLADSPPGDMTQAGNRAALAAAWANAGDAKTADDIAASALTSLSAYAAPSAETPRPSIRATGIQTDRVTALRVAIMAMSRDRKQSTLDTLQSGRAWTAADETWQAVQQTLLLDGLGRREESLGVLRKALNRDPNDQQLIVLYKDRLIEDGRDAELAQLAPRLAGSGFVANVLRQDVSKALRNLYRWREIPTEDGPDKAQSFDLMSAVASGDKDRLSTVFRSILLTLSNGNGMQPTITMPGVGGLNPVAPKSPPAALEAFAAWPGMTDAALETLHHPATVGPSAEWLATLITRASGKDAGLRQKLLDRLLRSHAHDTLSSGERMAIGMLATMPNAELPAELLDALWPMATAEPAGADMTRLAEALAVRYGWTFAAKWAEASGMPSRYGATVKTNVRHTPFDSPDDRQLSVSLSAMAEKDLDGVSRQFDAWRDAGRIQPRMIGTRLIGARLLAERGDWAGYESELNLILHDWLWQSAAGRAAGGTASAEFDVLMALPQRSKAVEAADVVLRALDAASADAPGVTDLSRAYAAAGEWALDRLGQAGAVRFLDKSMALSARQGPGEHQLWAADLARKMEQGTRAEAIERQLLAERCLPSSRIIPLIKRVRRQDATAALKMGSEAAHYLALPSDLGD